MFMPLHGAPVEEAEVVVVLHVSHKLDHDFNYEEYRKHEVGYEI